MQTVRSRGSFVDRYLERVAGTRSILCVGLDPTKDHVPPIFKMGLRGMKYYLTEIITLASDLVPVVKFNFGFYGAMGPAGMKLLTDLVKHAHSMGLLVIVDAKISDIGSSMEAYGKEVFGRIGADACTFVPYLGATFMASESSQSWEPWLKDGRMVISMIRTSNPEAAFLQDLKLESGETVYEYLAHMVGVWDSQVRLETEGLGGVGGVVGATWPKEAVRCRELAGDEVFFLIPGYGVQGGGAKDAVSALVGKNRLRIMGTVNSSRGITLSWRGKDGLPKENRDPMDLVCEAIDQANADLNTALHQIPDFSLYF